MVTKTRNNVNDYDPGWEYNVVKRPLPVVKNLVSSILKDLNDLKKALGFQNIQIHYIKESHDNLARYINGTMDNPHFVINARGIYNAAKKHGINLGTAIETTLVHEFGHAYLEMCGVSTQDHDEDVVEEFAREYNDSRDIKNSIIGLDEFVLKMDNI